MNGPQHQLRSLRKSWQASGGGPGKLGREGGAEEGMKIKIERLRKSQLQARKIEDWPIWECEPSTFDWHYDQQEQCFILEGQVRVKTATEEVAIGPGDFVTFPQGLDCEWTVKKAVRKHYSFS